MSYEYGGRNTKTFQKLQGFKSLVVWQKASDLAHAVSSALAHFDFEHRRLNDQMRGASISVHANIAEGYCSASVGNYIRYCLTARGSLGELGSYLQDCERDNLIVGQSLENILQLYSDTTFLLDKLISSLRQKEHEGTWDKQFWVKEQGEEYIAEAMTDEP
jgi:four helix bundle protein